MTGRIPLRTKCLLAILPFVLLLMFLIELSSDNAQQELRMRVSVDKMSAVVGHATQHSPAKWQDPKLRTNSRDTFQLQNGNVQRENAKPLNKPPPLFDKFSFKTEDKELPTLALVAMGSREKTRVRLIILAYMRTGSTMLGNILQINPNVFYWFEPLHKLGAYLPRKDYIEHHNLKGPHVMNQTWLDAIPITHAQAEEFTRSDVAAGNLSAILSCDLQRVWLGALEDQFTMGLGRDTQSLYACLVRARNQAALSKCLRNARDQCLGNRTVVALKTIRFHMVRALELMLADPKVRVLHLVRDPRAVLLSRYSSGYANFSQLPVEASRQCRAMANDLDLAHTVLDADIRRRYRLVRYEDIAANPVEAAKYLYKFIELEPSENDLQWVSRMNQSAMSRRQCWGCKSKVLTSQQVAQNWRLLASRLYTGLVSGPCTDVMLNLGYRLHFSSDDELRDLDVPVLVKPRYNTVWSPWLNG